MLISSADIKDDLTRIAIRDGEDVLIKQRSPAYIDEQLFEEYCNQVLFQYLSQLRKIPKFSNEPAVLIMDSCCAHITDNILQLLGENGVKVIVFPAHTTNIFQALDLVVFGALKTRMKHQNIQDSIQAQAQQHIYIISFSAPAELKRRLYSFYINLTLMSH